MLGARAQHKIGIALAEEVFLVQLASAEVERRIGVGAVADFARGNVENPGRAQFAAIVTPAGALREYANN